MTNPRPACRENKLTLTARRIGSGWSLLLYWFALTTATHWPIQFTPSTVGGVEVDNLLHGLFYAPLLWLLIGFFAFRPAGSWWHQHRLAIAVVMVLAWGAMDELTQPPFGRTTSIADWIGDAIGVLVAAGGVLAVRATSRRRSIASPT